jgi:hypothetical protein
MELVTIKQRSGGTEMRPFFLKRRNLIIGLIFLVAAVFGGVIIMAQQRHILSLEEVMTKSELTESGVASLSPAQRNVLELIRI